MNDPCLIILALCTFITGIVVGMAIMWANGCDDGDF